MTIEKLKKLAVFALITLILVYAYSVRSNTFWLSHWSGDQEHYIALAMKLSRFGMSEYNVQGVDVKKHFSDLHGKVKLIVAEALPVSGDENGYLLDKKGSVGIGIYDTPLYHIPPGFPFALMISNYLCGYGGVFTSPAVSINYLVHTVKPPAYIDAQFYSALVPLMFSLLLVFLTFRLGLELFSARVGLYAAFMMAANAVDIVTSQRIWPSDMVSSLLLLSALVYLAAAKKGRLPLYVAAGGLLGLAVLTRQNVIIFLAPVWIHQFCLVPGSVKGPKRWMKAAFNPRFVAFTAATVLVCCFWFIKTFQVYGTPLYDPGSHVEAVIAADRTGFTGTVLDRPPGVILYTIGIPFLSPAFVLAYASLAGLFRRQGDVAVDEELRRKLILLWSWIAVFFLVFAVIRSGSREHRYMLPAYPAIAVLAGYILSKLKALSAKYVGEHSIVLQELLVLAILVISAMHSVPIGIDQAVTDRALILKPF